MLEAPLIIPLAMSLHGDFVNGAGQDQTARNVQPDLRSTLSAILCQVR